MAIKHVKNYYDEITEQRNEIIQNLKDFEEECKSGMIEPERLDNIKKSIEPLLQNWERLTYIMYLLNLPVKKDKQSKYNKQNKKKISQLNKSNSLESVIEENNKCINKVNELVKG